VVTVRSARHPGGALRDRYRDEVQGIAMLETAAIFIGIAIGKKLIDHVGDSVGDAYDAALGRIGQWVRKWVEPRPTGTAAIELIAGASEGKDGEVLRDAGRKQLTAVLTEITTADQTAADKLQKLVEDLEKVAPTGLVVDGHVVAGEVIGGTTIGAEVSGLPGGSKVKGRVDVSEVHNGIVIGSKVRGG
jgi:hypothetical protein